MHLPYWEAWAGCGSRGQQPLCLCLITDQMVKHLGIRTSAEHCEMAAANFLIGRTRPFMLQGFGSSSEVLDWTSIENHQAS